MSIKAGKQEVQILLYLVSLRVVVVCLSLLNKRNSALFTPLLSSNWKCVLLQLSHVFQLIKLNGFTSGQVRHGISRAASLRNQCPPSPGHGSRTHFVTTRHSASTTWERTATCRQSLLHFSALLKSYTLVQRSCKMKGNIFDKMTQWYLIRGI